MNISRHLVTLLITFSFSAAERIPLSETSGRVLAGDIHSDVNIPSLDLSAMDGYACRAKDRDVKLRVIETIAAGIMPRKTVTPGSTCSRIMTGAPVPRGAEVM